MKVPNKIKTIVELKDWVIKNKPKIIEITENSKLNKYKYINLLREWDTFDGVKIMFVK